MHSTVLIVTVCLLYTCCSVLGKSHHEDDNVEHGSEKPPSENDTKEYIPEMSFDTTDIDNAEHVIKKPQNRAANPKTENDDKQNNDIKSLKKKQNKKCKGKRRHWKHTNKKNNDRGKTKGKYKERIIHPTAELKEYVKKAREAYGPKYEKLRESWNKTIEIDHNIENDQAKYLDYLLSQYENTENGKRQINMEKCVRKEYRSLTDEERERYHNAVQTLKTTYFEGSSASKYDLIAELHNDMFAPVAHFGPCFLPWHREYLLIYEIALREAYPDVCLPYIDTCIDGKLRTQNYNTALFASDTLGNPWNHVTTGAFGDFVPHGRCNYRQNRIFRYVQREWGLLHNDDDFALFKTYTEYTDLAWPMNRAFENTHGGAHLWIEGHMNDLNCAASDPAFFMHHCYVDYLWEQFRLQNQTTDQSTDYVSDNDLWRYGISERAYPLFPMLPFGDLGEMLQRNITLKRNHQVLNSDGLSTDYAEWYSYEKAPCQRECETDSDCGTARVWCRDGECVAQVREGRWCYWDSARDISDPRSCFCKDPNATPTCGNASGNTRACTCITNI